MNVTLTTLIALAVLTAPAAAGAQGAPDRSRTVVRERAAAPAPTVLYQRGAQVQTERVTRTLKMGTAGELAVSNLSGHITVTRGGGSEATVEIVKTARAATAEDARQMLDLVTVDVTERGGRAEIRAQYPQRARDDRRSINVSVAYTISAPAETRLTIRSLSGNIRVTDIRGDLTLDTMSGQVDVTGAARIASAKSVSGSVTIAATKSDGTIAASSMSGNVTLRDVEARRLSLNTVSGNVIMDNTACERADAQSMSGNVVYTGRLARSGRYDLKSHSGSVRLTVDEGTGFEVDATTFSGSIRSDLPLTTRAGETLQASPGRRRAFRGTFGDGSAVVNITTFSGSVVLGKR